jgi:hypothetical protein
VKPRNFGITTQIPLDYKTVPPVLNKSTKSIVVSGMKSITYVIMANGGNCAHVITTFLWRTLRCAEIVMNIAFSQSAKLILV